MAFRHTFLGQLCSILLLLFWLFLEITDVLDGYLARKHQLVSDIGKLMDPFGDVFSRITFFFCFAQSQLFPYWPILIIIWRELSITFMRAILIKGGVTLAASKGGKMKAVFYFLASAYGSIILLLASWGHWSLQSTPWLYASIGGYIIIIGAAIAALWSFVSYFMLFIRTPYVRQFIEE